MRRPDSQYPVWWRVEEPVLRLDCRNLLDLAQRHVRLRRRSVAPCGRLRRLALEVTLLRAFPRTLDHDIRGPPAVTGPFMRESLDGGAGSGQGVAQLSRACVARAISH